MIYVYILTLHIVLQKCVFPRFFPMVLLKQQRVVRIFKNQPFGSLQTSIFSNFPFQTRLGIIKYSGWKRCQTVDKLCFACSNLTIWRLWRMTTPWTIIAPILPILISVWPGNGEFVHEVCLALYRTRVCLGHMKNMSTSLWNHVEPRNAQQVQSTNKWIRHARNASQIGKAEWSLFWSEGAD